MSVELKLRAPYVGPSAFREGDVLYGRDAEALDLCDLLIASRIVLLSSPSGAGKTSLIQARIVPDMRKEGFRIHPLIRVGGAPQSLSGVDNQPANRYVNCTINCLEHDQPGATPDGNGRHLDVNLSRYLDLRSAEDDAESELFIFDQFEEILTADPTDQDAKREFFRQLGAVLRKPHRWALFAIREDYAASLEPYARRVPTGLRTTYHLECLGPTDARRAIQEPALRAGVTITDDAANRLVDDLRQVRVQHPDGSVTEERGPYIEPVQLQIACLRVWHLVNPEPGARIEVESLPPRTTVNEALADYYADQMCAVATHTRVPERKIRDWIQTYLITPQDIRGQVPLGPDLTQGLENAAVKGLENAYILREDRRGNAIWYELAHDRLVRPIQQNNAHWFATHLNVLQQQAALWDRSGRARGLLLGGTALDDQAAWADQHAAELSEVERRYLDESKHARDEEEREHRNARRILRLFVVVCVLLVGMIFASGLAWVLRQQAEQARADAVAAQITAEAAQVAADNARLTAEEQGRIAQSRAVTAAAMSQLLQDPETSVLLALEALKIQETSDAEAALRLSLAQSHVRSVVRGHTKSVLSVAFSPDGTRVLTASQDQTARVADAATGKSLSILSGHTGWIFKAMFDRGGGRVITAGVDGTARIWTADSGTPIAVLQGQSQPVTYAEFSPGGRRAVTASQSGTAWIWDVSSALPARRVEVQQDGWIRAARFSPDGQRLVTASRDGTARVWSTASGAQLAAFDEHTGGLLNAVFSPDGTRVLTTSEDKTARVWDASSGALQSVLAGHRENVNGGMFSPDGKQVLSWSDDGTARVWVADGGALVTEIRGQEDPITSASFSPDGHWVVTASMDGTARIWDARSGREFQQLRGHHDIVAAAEFSPDGSHVVTGSGDGTAESGRSARRAASVSTGISTLYSRRRSVQMGHAS